MKNHVYISNDRIAEQNIMTQQGPIECGME